MDSKEKKMLGYKDDEPTVGESNDLPEPTFDMVGLIIACNQFLIDYHNKYGMLPSQNPDIKLWE